MRLNSIKLAAFKSFAEPTTLAVPGQLIGVVGPNGCGKSNIMDAVRWVLGESRASELRGQTMQDVIFNGTDTRKAASRASVELVFDNHDHRVSGQWNAYAEIAVKRVVTRDGSSSYFINGQPVRRRDVRDVFMGTGLGPRAYAIIGQGTISRIVESRPEDLRLYLEEAAGVSKYRERRRETERRLRESRENLARLGDLVHELHGQLRRLERQAEQARRYRALESRQLRQIRQLHWLEMQAAAGEQARWRADKARTQQHLDEGAAALARLQLELEKRRQDYHDAGNSLNSAQALLYEVNAELGRLQAEIRFVAESRKQAETRAAQLLQLLQGWQARSQDAADRLGTLATEEQNLQQERDEIGRRTQAASDGLDELLQERKAARKRRDVTGQALTELRSGQQEGLARKQSMQQQLSELASRRQRLQAEQGQLTAVDPDELQGKLRALQLGRQDVEQIQQDAAATQQQLLQQGRNLQQCQERLSRADSDLTRCTAELEALQAMQQRIASAGQLPDWLRRVGLDPEQALWAQIQIAAGWEKAVDAALQQRLYAFSVRTLDDALRWLTHDQPPPTRLSAYPILTQAAVDQPMPPHPELEALADKIATGQPALDALIRVWLADAWCTGDLRLALQWRGQLPTGARIFCADGHSVSREALDFYAEDSERAGVLVRAGQITALAEQGVVLQQERDQVNALFQQRDAARAQTQRQLQELQKRLSERGADLHRMELECQRLQQQHEHSNQRGEQIARELADLQERELRGRQNGQGLASRLAQLDKEVRAAADGYAKARQNAQDLEIRAETARQAWDKLQVQGRELDFRLQRFRDRRSDLQEHRQAAELQLRSLGTEHEQMQQKLRQLTDQAVQQGLQTALALKVEREKAVATQRSLHDGLGAEMRSRDEARLRQERALEPLRQQLTEQAVAEQGAAARVQQHLDALEQEDVDLQAVERTCQEDAASLAKLPQQLKATARGLQALGDVNLAALAELDETRERKTALDGQLADLQEACVTLESAIRKIDAETRALLEQTFASVNQHFGDLFPQLFGGGSARLELTGGEILDAGVQVMAQPPGKKNQTIQLLSGGEKALTAIALVFAIFQLNPAPFCLLDEVDAPLDEANTDRYSQLVASMSRRGTQFLFISHNRIAMEMAQQLIGVTMQEQGVSRIVAVDMQDALKLAQPLQ